MRVEEVYFFGDGEVRVPDGLTVAELTALAAAATRKATSLQRVTEAEGAPASGVEWVRVQAPGDFLAPGPA